MNLILEEDWYDCKYDTSTNFLIIGAATESIRSYNNVMDSGCLIVGLCMQRRCI